MRAIRFVVTLQMLTLFAAPPKPVGSVSTNGTVLVSGTVLECKEVPSWPLVAGDVIEAARAEPAMMSFADGSRVLLDKGSRVKLVMREQALTVVLVGGSAAFSMSANSTMKVYADSNLVGGQGSRRHGTATTVRLSGRGAADLESNLNRWNPSVTDRETAVISPYKP